MTALDEQLHWEKVGELIGERVVSWRGMKQADFEKSKGVTSTIAEKLLGQHAQIRLLQGAIRKSINASFRRRDIQPEDGK